MQMLYSPLRWLGTGALVVALFCVAGAAKAQTSLFSNLNESVEDFNYVGGGGTIYQAFQTDGNAYAVSEVTLKLITDSPDDIFRISLYEYDPTSALNLVGVVGDITTVGASWADITVIPTDSIVLQANTSYWLGATFIDASSPNFLNWAVSYSPNSDGVFMVLDTPSVAISNDGGATFIDSSNVSNGKQMFQIKGSVTDVPEPATLALLLSVPLAGLRMRRRA